MDNFSTLLPANWKIQVDSWLHEDIPSFDFGGFVVGNKHEKAEIVCKQNGVLCGTYFATHIFTSLGCTVEWKKSEGEYIDVSEYKGRCPVAYIEGPACYILQGERIALNLMARASGIATRARQAKQIADSVGWKGYVAGTRKTTPGFRLIEKYSLLVGGVSTHRNDLSSMVMLKDNHVQSVGSITEAVKKARQVAGFSTKIEVECQNKEEAEEALLAGAEIVMLDNHHPEILASPSQYLKEKFPNSLIEASGGITLENIKGYMLPTVDIISLGSLTQSVNHIDFSLNIGAKTTIGKS